MQNDTPGHARKTNKLTRLRKGLLWELTNRAGSKAISFIVFAILANFLDPIDFGLVAAARIFTDYCDSFAGQGFGFALIQRPDVTLLHKNTAFTLNVVVASLLAIILFAFAEPIARFMVMEELAAVIKWLSVVIVLSSLSKIQFSLMAKEMQLGPIAKIQIGVSLVSGLTGVVCAISGLGVWSLVWMQLVNAGLLSITAWGISPWKPKFIFHVQSMKDIYSFSLKMLLAMNISFLSNKSGEIVIASFLGPVALGYYSIAKRFVDLVANLFFSALDRVSFIEFSRIQQRPEEVRKKLLKAIHFASYVSAPVFVGASVISPVAISLIFSPEWNESILPFAILALSGVGLTCKHLIAPLYYAMNRGEIELYISVIRLFTGLVLLFLLGAYGLPGIALAITIREIGVAIILGLYLPRLIGGSYLEYYRPQLGAVLATVPMAGICYLLSYGLVEFQAPVQAGVLVVVGAVTYFATLIICRMDYKFWRQVD
jgi:polysaccharide transporter, PST family